VCRAPEPINWLDQINAQKDFMLAIDGPEDLTNWLAQTLMMMQTSLAGNSASACPTAVPCR
jgi:hypothetical protein